MNQETVRQPSAKIVCPECGTVLAVKIQPHLDSKFITCPVCKNKNPYLKFKHVESHIEATAYINSGNNTQLGTFFSPFTGQTFKLRMGRNIVGRECPGSVVDIQLRCINKRISREHLVVEVENLPGHGLVHRVSLCKDNVNPTFIGNLRLEYGDCIVLSNHDVIKLPEGELRFIIPDEYGTEY